MFNFPAMTIIKLGAVGIVLAIILYHVYDDWSTSNDLEEARVELIAKKEALRAIEEAFTAATQDRDSLRTKIEEADKERAKIQLDLKSALIRLKGQQAPKECKAAIDWAVYNKSDLSW